MTGLSVFSESIRFFSLLDKVIVIDNSCESHFAKEARINADGLILLNLLMKVGCNLLCDSMMSLSLNPFRFF